MGGWDLIGHWRLPGRYDLLHILDVNDPRIPSPFRRKIAPRIWYFMVNAGAVFFLPFLGIYWRTEENYSTTQIGLLQTLRPWTNAVSGNLVVSLADVLDVHYVSLLLTYSLTMISRGLIVKGGWSFAIMIVLALIMEAAVSPMGVLVDSTVVSGSVKVSRTFNRTRCLSLHHICRVT